ncbi:MAG: hypothetical protein H6838_11165 [Planctomycetes bacterium]|nr:hypothetical protein [Planctomycetota bacterium]
MNRQDLEFVGVRLLGLYFTVQGVASLPGMLAPGFGTHWSFFLPPVLYLLAGLLLAIGTSRVLGWLAIEARLARLANKPASREQRTRES